MTTTPTTPENITQDNRIKFSFCTKCGRRLRFPTAYHLCRGCSDADHKAVAAPGLKRGNRYHLTPEGAEKIHGG